MGESPSEIVSSIRSALHRKNIDHSLVEKRSIIHELRNKLAEEREVQIKLQDLFLKRENEITSEAKSQVEEKIAQLNKENSQLKEYLEKKNQEISKLLQKQEELEKGYNANLALADRKFREREKLLENKYLTEQNSIKENWRKEERAKLREETISAVELEIDGLVSKQQAINATKLRELETLYHSKYMDMCEAKSLMWTESLNQKRREFEDEIKILKETHMEEIKRASNRYEELCKRRETAIGELHDNEKTKYQDKIHELEKKLAKFDEEKKRAILEITNEKNEHIEIIKIEAATAYSKDKLLLNQQIENEKSRLISMLEKKAQDTLLTYTNKIRSELEEKYIDQVRESATTAWDEAEKLVQRAKEETKKNTEAAQYEGKVNSQASEWKLKQLNNELEIITQRCDKRGEEITKLYETNTSFRQKISELENTIIEFKHNISIIENNCLEKLAKQKEDFLNEYRCNLDNKEELEKKLNSEHKKYSNLKEQYEICLKKIDEQNIIIEQQQSKKEEEIQKMKSSLRNHHIKELKSVAAEVQEQIQERDDELKRYREIESQNENEIQRLELIIAKLRSVHLKL